MTLAEIYAQIALEAKRGTTLDSIIPAKVATAVRWIEETHTFKYMEKFSEVSLDADADYPNVVAVPAGFREMNFWRFNRLDYQALNTERAELPSGYWQDGMEYFWIRSTPHQSFVSEMSWIADTVLPTDTSKTTFILTRHSELIVSQTMVLLGPTIRDDKAIQRYKSARDDLFASAINADTKMRMSNRDEFVDPDWRIRRDDYNYLRAFDSLDVNAVGGY